MGLLPLISFALGAVASPLLIRLGSLSPLLIRRIRRKHSPVSAHPGTDVQYVHPPHPAWKPGQAQPHPFKSDEMIQFDPNTVEKAHFYSLLISAVTPRPVAFVSTKGSDGSINVAPYSYFNILSNDPPILALGCARHGGRPPVNGVAAKKDTLINIEETGEFVINIISDWFVEAANYTCADFDHGVDEFAAAGLTPVPSVAVGPPRVKESAVQFECKLRQVIALEDRGGKPTTVIVLGEVVLCHVNKEATEPSPTGKVVIDPIKLRPVCRFGGVQYGRITELYELARPLKDGSFPAFKSRAQAREEAASSRKAK